MPTARLLAHPDTPCPAVTALAVEIAPGSDGSLALTYRLTGAIETLVIPTTATPARTDGLWRHTCFEAFVMAGDGPGYREFNFSPSGEWAAYAFAGYRDGARDLPMPAPTITCRAEAGHLILAATLPAPALPAGKRRLGLSAVIKTTAGRIAYWALHHAPGQPDFHHTEAFALTLEP